MPVGYPDTKYPSGTAETHPPKVHPIHETQRSGVAGMVMRYTLVKVCVRCGDCSHEKQGRPQDLVRR